MESNMGSNMESSREDGREADTKCIHDPAVECVNRMECFKCPLYEAIMTDYPH